MIRLILLLLSATAVISCSGGEKIPDGILPPDRMQVVYWDMMRADEMISYYVPTDSTYVNRRGTLYDQIYKVHKISRDTWRRSERYYEGRPDLLKPILDSLEKKAQRPAQESTSPRKGAS